MNKNRFCGLHTFWMKTLIFFFVNSNLLFNLICGSLIWILATLLIFPFQYCCCSTAISLQDHRLFIRFLLSYLKFLVQFWTSNSCFHKNINILTSTMLWPSLMQIIDTYALSEKGLFVTNLVFSLNLFTSNVNLRTELYCLTNLNY